MAGVAGAGDLEWWEVEAAAEVVHQAVHPDVKTIFGLSERLVLSHGRRAARGDVPKRFSGTILGPRLIARVWNT